MPPKKGAPEDPIFGDRMAAEKAIKTAIRGRDLRAIRRGGLQAMARSGAMIGQLLDFSKHQTEKMLMKYLAAFFF